MYDVVQSRRSAAYRFGSIFSQQRTCASTASCRTGSRFRIIVEFVKRTFGQPSAHAYGVPDRMIPVDEIAETVYALAVDPTKAGVAARRGRTARLREISRWRTSLNPSAGARAPLARVAIAASFTGPSTSIVKWPILRRATAWRFPYMCSSIDGSRSRSSTPCKMIAGAGAENVHHDRV